MQTLGKRMNDHVSRYPHITTYKFSSFAYYYGCKLNKNNMPRFQIE
jgi:hypothetical protein